MSDTPKEIETEEHVPVIVMRDQLEDLLAAVRDIEYASLDFITGDIRAVARTIEGWLKTVDAQ